MRDDITRDDITRKGGGYGPADRPEALPRPARPAVPAVPPMEAEWLRVVSGRPIGGDGPLGGRRNGSAAPPSAGNGRPGGGVDSTRGRH